MRDLASIQSDNINAALRNRSNDVWALLMQIASGVAGQDQARAMVGSLYKTAVGTEFKFKS